MSFMSPLPDGAMDKLNEAILEFTSLFAQFMLLGYFEVWLGLCTVSTTISAHHMPCIFHKQVAIEKAKEKAEEKVEDDPEQLLPLPVPDWTIKSGWMTKEGGNYHS
jgi:hypothetical protein